MWMLYRSMLWHGMVCVAVSRCTMLCYGLLRYLIVCDVVPCCIISHYVTLFPGVLCYVAID